MSPAPRNHQTLTNHHSPPPSAFVIFPNRFPPHNSLHAPSEFAPLPAAAKKTLDRFGDRDGSLNVRLDAFPLNGQLHIRDEAPRPGSDQSEPESDP